MTDDSDDVMPGSSGSLVESIRDFGEEEEEEEEAQNEEGEMIEAKVR